MNTSLLKYNAWGVDPSGGPVQDYRWVPHRRGQDFFGDTMIEAFLAWSILTGWDMTYPSVSIFFLSSVKKVYLRSSPLASTAVIFT